MNVSLSSVIIIADYHWCTWFQKDLSITWPVVYLFLSIHFFFHMPNNFLIKNLLENTFHLWRGPFCHLTKFLPSCNKQKKTVELLSRKKVRIRWIRRISRWYQLGISSKLAIGWSFSKNFYSNTCHLMVPTWYIKQACRRLIF